ncbi:MAG: LysE family translocator [Lentilitoribacter sp.]
MPSYDILIAFIIATALFGYMPGPALLYASARTIADGRKAGFMAALGLHIGGYVHVFAAAFGLAALFTLVPVLYTVLKFAGAAYLVFLGIKLIISKSKHDATAKDVAQKSPKRAFFESMTVEILNPKTAIFYVAFLPQFTDVAAAFPIWLQLVILGIVVNVVFSSADVICVFLAHKIATAFRKLHSANRWAERMGGGLLVGLGAHLAFFQK